jgi:hypothetical protein
VIDTRERRTCEGKARLCATLERLEPEVVLRGSQQVTAFELYRCAVPAGGEIPLPRWRQGRR